MSQALIYPQPSEYQRNRSADPHDYGCCGNRGCGHPHDLHGDRPDGSNYCTRLVHDLLLVAVALTGNWNPAGVADARRPCVKKAAATPTMAQLPRRCRVTVAPRLPVVITANSCAVYHLPLIRLKCPISDTYLRRMGASSA